ncbi:GTPase-associated system all-helical protein GASH [Anaerospora sp.]|uniref:GTPase-associated system all-helical protein GASH n=1 Tax=Anaerospora sp. TaxID=1960278 RepID=UPI002899A0DD|nr:GTPase-associated system all-helical protein GASH [Anaerospora sp.]
MRDKFCEWYRIVCVDPTHEKLQNRWDSLQKYCDKEEFNILELTKLFFGFTAEESFRTEFIKSYSDRDMTFPNKSDQEILLLAGVTLLQLLERKKQEINIVISVMCLSLFKKDVIIPEIVDIVSNKLNEFSLSIRNEKIKQSINPITDKGISELAESLESGTWSVDDVESFSEILTRIAANFNILENNQKKILESIEVYKEDSNILSWLFGEWSNDLSKPLNKKIDQSQISFILGKELADLVQQVPGPYSAKAFLVKMLGHCKADKSNITLVEMIDLLDKKWKKQLLNDYSIIAGGENTPVMLAIYKSLETSEPNVWKYAYQNVMGINVEEVKSDPLTWSYQMYLECLLIKDNISED